jgi:predicted patatin/cPLA2 family phospholipase
VKAEISGESLRDDYHYVLLVPSLEEQLLTREELILFLEKLLQEYPHLLDSDLQRYPDRQSQVHRLMETTCSMEIAPGETIHWYAVRLKKSSRH